MKLAHEFIRLPLTFDIERLQHEVSLFSESDWVPHHQKFIGNYAIPLISVDGKNNNAFKGEMKPTPALLKSKYMLQVLASFNEVFGRSRLMRLDPGSEVPLHSDINYYWYNRVRIHIPIVTDPKVIFYCNDRKVHMAAGETWLFDSWKNHRVVNHSNVNRVHLVIDTSGSSKFWQMANSSHVPWLNQAAQSDRFVSFNADDNPSLSTEAYNAPLVMSPGELDGLVYALKEEINRVAENDEEKIRIFNGILDGFRQDWRQLSAQYGFNKSGWDKYHLCRDATYHKAKLVGAELKLTNGGSALDMLTHCIIDPAFNPEVFK